MTPREQNINGDEDSGFAEIVQGLKEINQKLCKITELLHDSLEAGQPYDNNWTEFYDLDDE